MPQVLVTQNITGLQNRNYTVGQVVTFPSDLVDWLKGRRQVDDTTATVNAAIAAGAVVLKHYAAKPAPGESAVKDHSSAAIVLSKRNSLTKGLLTGRMIQAVSGVDHTTQIEFTLEAEPGTIEVGILNNIAAVLTGVKVAIAFSPVAGVTRDADGLAALNAGTWLAMALGGSTAGANIAAASAVVTNDNPNVTWFDAGFVAPPARTDGGSLTDAIIRVEIPAANANIPASFWTDLGELENEGSPTVAPFGRFIRASKQAVLGVTNKAAFTSIAPSGSVVPVLIRYTPRNPAVKGFTWAVFDNSLGEGVTANATARRVGWTGRVQRDLSTPTSPIEICNFAIHGASQSRVSTRMTTLLPLVMPEVYSYQVSNINSAVVGGNAAQALTDMNGIRAWNNLARAGTNSIGALPVALASLPSNFAARPVVAYDKLRLALNAEYSALKSPRELFIDIATPFSGPVDSNGQTTIAPGLTADQLHDNDTGAEVIAAAATPTFRMIQAAA